MKNPYKSGKFKVTSPYGMRTDPFDGSSVFHTGIDLCGLYDPADEPPAICAFSDGTVVRSRVVLDKNDRTSEWGEYVALREDSGNVVYFCHLSKRSVESGAVVKAGSVIGYEGATGRSTGRHLHLEIRDKSGKPVNAADYIGVKNEIGSITPISSELSDADAVCERCGLSAETRKYIDSYRFSGDLWRKLRAAMK